MFLFMVLANSVLVRLRFGFQDEVKWRLGRSTELAEPGFFHYLAQSTLPSLRAQCEANFLTARIGGAHHCRKPVKNSSYRIQVFLQAVSGKRFNNHPGAIRLQAFARMR